MSDQTPRRRGTGSFARVGYLSLWPTCTGKGAMGGRVMIIALLSLVSERSACVRRSHPIAQRTQLRWVGAQMPELRVRNSDYEVMTFGPEQLTAPTVSIFYRRGWSSECLRHLRRLKEAHSTLCLMGFAVEFVSADAPQNLRASAQNAALPYDLLPDSQMQAARVRCGLPGGRFTAGRYEHLGVDLEIFPARRSMSLLLPRHSLSTALE